ncbi:fibronectin type III domain-containing protein 11 [Podargus strigoides]
MAMTASESEARSESTACGEEKENNGSSDLYTERKNLLMEFLHSRLTPAHIQQYQNKAEAAKKCYFYLDIEPKHLELGNDENVAIFTDILQVIAPCQLQKIKEVGRKQVEIHHTLLTELLEQLERSRIELNCYVAICDREIFLSHWDSITQSMSKVSEYTATLFSLKMPAKLRVKHRLVPHEQLGGSRLPSISISLCAKMPLLFDRRESFAQSDGIRLKWFSEDEESNHEKCELYCQLLTDRNQREPGFGATFEFDSNTCVIQNLQPGRLYKFTVRRLATPTYITAKWHDSIILKNRTNAMGDVDNSVCAQG